MAKTELHSKWLVMRALGLSYGKISKRLGVSKQTQIKWSKKFADELQSIKAKEIKFITDSLEIAKQHRIERLTNQLEKIENELEKRDVSDMPTLALLKEFSNIIKAIQSEADEKKPKEDQIDESMATYLNIISQITRPVESEE